MKPEVALILEGTTANDMPEAEGHQHVTKVGAGPAISFMDGGTIVRPKMFEALKRTAEEAGIPFQIRQGTRGGTDAAQSTRRFPAASRAVFPFPAVTSIPRAASLPSAILKTHTSSRIPS